MSSDLGHSTLRAGEPPDYCWLEIIRDQSSWLVMCVFDGWLAPWDSSIHSIERDYSIIFFSSIVYQKSFFLPVVWWVVGQTGNNNTCPHLRWCTVNLRWPHFGAEWDLLISAYASSLDYLWPFEKQWTKVGLKMWIALWFTQWHSGVCTGRPVEGSLCWLTWKHGCFFNGNETVADSSHQIWSFHVGTHSVADLRQKSSAGSVSMSTFFNCTVCFTCHQQECAFDLEISVGSLDRSDQYRECADAGLKINAFWQAASFLFVFPAASPNSSKWYVYIAFFFFFTLTAPIPLTKYLGLTRRLMHFYCILKISIRLDITHFHN